MIALLVFLPLIAALIVGLSVRIISPKLAQIITCGAMVASAILAGFVFYDFAFGEGGVQKINILPWIISGDFTSNWTLRVDSVTAVMFVVVTWVSAVVHLYSIGYMHHDEHEPRFMAYLSLFTFFMLMLITADNLVQLFLGWEGVGLCSYLLIGFWFKKESACNAAMKAFIVNRVGDFGFALGIFATFVLFGSVQFDTIFAAVSAHLNDKFLFLGHNFPALTLICILLFIGAMGKSAQLGLHTWLPDAMEGPTPVSALIHAATMVTAGVFMVVRLSPLFEASHDAMNLVCVVGACTAFFAATVGLVQNDIKRVIAYSTCSQLGYMFFACGVGAYSAAMFHLMTHAFFKALLFLSAGSVSIGMHHEQDIWQMGNLRKKMPVTFWTFLIGALALSGVPPFSGFYSKDSIFAQALEQGREHPLLGYPLFGVAVFVAALTAFYTFRLFFVVFFGQEKSKAASHAHESPAVITLPLVALAVFAVIGGVIGIANNFGSQFSADHESLTFLQQVTEPLKNIVLYMII